MARYQVECSGTAEYYCTFTVEADSEKEAERKALAGEGEVEEESYDGGDLDEILNVTLEPDDHDGDDEAVA